MVVFVDLDDPDEVEHQHQHQHGHNTPFDMRGLINAHTTRSTAHTIEQEIESEEEDAEQEHPNLNALSAVLGNYPFVASSRLDIMDDRKLMNLVSIVSFQRSQDIWT